MNVPYYEWNSESHRRLLDRTVLLLVSSIHTVLVVGSSYWGCVYTQTERDGRITLYTSAASSFLVIISIVAPLYIVE